MGVLRALGPVGVRSARRRRAGHLHVAAGGRLDRPQGNVRRGRRRGRRRLGAAGRPEPRHAADAVGLSGRLEDGEHARRPRRPPVPAHRRRVAAGLADRDAQPSRLPGPRGHRADGRRGRRRLRRHQTGQGRRPSRLAGGDDAGRSAGRARRRPADRHRDLVHQWTLDLHRDRRLGVPPGGQRDLLRRGAGPAGHDDDRRGVLLRGLSGRGGPRRRLRPAGLGPGAGRLLPQGRRHLRRGRPASDLDARSRLRPAAGRCGGPRHRDALHAGAEQHDHRADRAQGDGLLRGRAQRRARPGQEPEALLPGDDAPVRRLQRRDGLHLVPGERALAVRRRAAPGGLRHRRPHPAGADLGTPRGSSRSRRRSRPDADAGQPRPRRAPSVSPAAPR